MALFRRKRQDDAPNDPGDPAVQARGVDAFWSWWRAEGADGVAAAIRDEAVQEWADRISQRVNAVHPDLEWELGPGDLSRHSLVVTSGGEPALRATARRWLLAAPEADETWSYSDTRQATAGDWSLAIHGRDVDLASAVVTARVEGTHVDVLVHHPSYEGLDETTRQQVTYLLLDGVLGEQAVEAWVGAVTSAGSPPLDAFPLTGLPAVVDEVRREHTDEDGRPSWVLLTGETADGDPVLAAAQVPLSPVVAPHLDTHLGIRLGYDRRTDRGLPDETSLDLLRALEDRLNGTLDARTGAVVAHETTSGSRTLHVYVDATTDALTRVDAVLGEWSSGPVAAEAVPDPAWHAVRHLRH